MEKITIICDKCGQEINPSSKYRNRLNITLTYWHGGSCGGPEDEDHFINDLCGSCAKKLSYLITDFLKNNK